MTDDELKSLIAERDHMVRKGYASSIKTFKSDGGEKSRAHCIAECRLVLHLSELAEELLDETLLRVESELYGVNEGHARAHARNEERKAYLDAISSCPERC